MKNLKEVKKIKGYVIGKTQGFYEIKSKDKISFTVRDYKADIRKDAAEKLKELEKAMTKGRA